MDISDGLAEVDNLYANLPEVPCISCGLCCVSPHMTFIEFTYLLDGILKNDRHDILIKLVSEAPESEKRYPGNFHCRLQDIKGTCSLYPFRPIMCRLEGIPILDRMGVRNCQLCPYIKDEDMKVEVIASDIDTWVAESFTISGKFYPVYEEPYWLSALTAECWLALAMDDTISQKEVVTVQKLIRENFDLDFLAPHFVDITGFSEVLDLADSFFQEAQNGHPWQALRAIRRILYDFPNVGSYYQEEGKKYFQLMRQIVNEQRQK